MLGLICVAPSAELLLMPYSLEKLDTAYGQRRPELITQRARSVSEVMPDVATGLLFEIAVIVLIGTRREAILLNAFF